MNPDQDRPTGATLRGRTLTGRALPGRSLPRAVGRVLAVVMVLGACAGGPAPAAGPAGPAGASGAAADPAAESRAELEALYRARVDSARMRFTEADVAFMQGMIHHHAQAIEMARLAPERASHASIRTLAARVINAQEDEIATMQRWLRDRDQPAPEVHVMGDRVMVHGPTGHGHDRPGADHEQGGHGDEHALMPGMLSREEIRALERASGPAFDRLFLESMIRHHRGAVTMVRELFATDGAAQDEDAFRFATDVQVDQATEIARMERMLADLTADGSS